MCPQCVSSLRVYRACGEPDWGAGGGPCAHSAYPPCVCTERVASLTGEQEARVPTVRILPAVYRACGEPDCGGGPCAHSAYLPAVCTERVASLTGELEEARVPQCVSSLCVQSVWRA